MSSGKVLLGVLAGVAAGALLGILLAPEIGSDTRKKISKKREGYTDALKGKFNDFLDHVSEKFEEVKEEVSDMAGQGKAKAEEAVKGAK